MALESISWAKMNNLSSQTKKRARGLKNGLKTHPGFFALPRNPKFTLFCPLLAPDLGTGERQGMGQSPDLSPPGTGPDLGERKNCPLS